MTFSIDFMVKVSLIHGETLLFAQTDLPQQSFFLRFSHLIHKKSNYLKGGKKTPVVQGSDKNSHSELLGKMRGIGCDFMQTFVFNICFF